MRFNCDAGVALTHSQINNAIHKLFARRLDRAGLALPIASNHAELQPLVNPPSPPQHYRCKKHRASRRAFTLLIVVLAKILALVF